MRKRERYLSRGWFWVQGIRRGYGLVRNSGRNCAVRSSVRKIQLSFAARGRGSNRRITP